MNKLNFGFGIEGSHLDLAMVLTEDWIKVEQTSIYIMPHVSLLM